VAVPRLVASVISATMALAFWWALTEPLRLSPVVLYSIPASILFICGVTAGRMGVIAAPIALAFSLLLGSIIATQLHQAFVPSSTPVSTLAGIAIDPSALPLPLALSALAGLAGGFLGERLLPTRREWPGR
jgi:hypothetical protein